jgi:hypothetical protein
MSEKPDYIKKLEQSECECVSCKVCKGTGNYYVDLKGKYISGPTDDLFDIETCDFCSNGIAETCERCAQLESYDFEILDFYVEKNA